MKAYLLHLRPLGFPYFGLTYAAGYLLAYGHATWVNAGLFFAGFFVWVVCLNGGTLCFNSYYDKDEGAVAFLDAPPEPPKYLHVFGLFLMLAGFFSVILFYPKVLILPYASCVLLSVLYSHTKIRMKNIVGAAELINMYGYGFVSPFASFALTGRALSGRWWLVFCATMLWNLGGYWITQVYQIAQDRAKGDSTFSTRFGREATLRAAFSVMTGALLVFTAAVFSGLYPKDTLMMYFPAVFIGIPFMRYWLHRAKPEEDKKMMYLGLCLYTFTGCCILFGMRGNTQPPVRSFFLSPQNVFAEEVQMKVLPEDFQKGVSYVSWWHGTYLSPESDAMLEHLKNINVQWVALVTTWYQEKKDSADIFRDKEKSHTDEELVHAMKKIKSLNMRVMLKPHIDVNDGAWRGEIAFSGEKKRAEWFASYEKFIVHFARLAEENKAEMLCIGTELEQMTRDEKSAERWSALIKKIKSAYHGKLTYAANWSEYESVPFWCDVDFAGIDAYFPLAITKDVSEEQLAKSFHRVLTRLSGWQKKIKRPVLFTEIGYRSMDGAAVMPWDWKLTGAADGEEQAVLYKVALEGVMKKSWMKGVYFWAVSPSDKNATENDTGYTFYGKPAEKMLSEFYSRQK